ncbi:MBL fold metallo-hydrolase [Kribbella sp. NPDC026611]|uniref:MBL fold metallo-hydrolase n=1 Tax=Kribbella sp. NPDC026611 TaxID=3154911 RepID=UPI0033CFCA6B
MKVHHLNCGTMNSPVARWVCHVLLVESPVGLVLVDSGYGLADIAAPAERLGFVRRVVRPVLDPAETAIRQVERLGFAADDVRHVVLTHLDLDHIGGLADFPWAEVHVSAAEGAAMHAPTFQDRVRYRPVQWAHEPRVVEHATDGELWHGFPAAREIVTPGLVYVAMPGHTRGHAAVAVEADDGWLLHAGDAFFHHGRIDGTPVPRALRIHEQVVAVVPRKMKANQARLAELHRDPDAGVRIFCAHDPAQFESVAG